MTSKVSLKILVATMTGTALMVAEDIGEFCKENNFVETMFGRKCNIKGINDKNFAVRGFAERQSINAPIQGTAADLIKIAMNKTKSWITDRF